MDVVVDCRLARQFLIFPFLYLSKLYMTYLRLTKRKHEPDKNVFSVLYSKEINKLVEAKLYKY